MASHRLKRTMRGALAASAVVVAVGLAPTTPALADPELPANASEAMKQLQEMSKETEKVAESLHEAKDDLNKKNADLEKANKEAEEASKLGALAREQERQLRGDVDKMASADFEGARLNQLSALLMSRSPNEFLDKMALLDMLAGDNKDAIDKLHATIKQAEDAGKRAVEAKDRAQKATDEAKRITTELDKRRAELETRRSKVKAQYDKLTQDERNKLKGPEDNSVINIPGNSGIAGAALEKALSKRGSRYVYGDEGPSTFDCSGLIYWAYQQVGMTLPRSSSQQARIGTAVPVSAIQPGDLVAYKGHIGISVGNGKMVHAPTTGDVVKIAPLQSGIVAVRRVGVGS
ncbi:MULTISPECIES: C40 family peptidase [unclassified Crossiella]|uniref:C40 family peptidase n=1 Tax=unclassified Crossiella TaxID=2620835 RepID=UPI001FFEC617|nr:MULTISPECIES: C40 family peptidase [unclassified Crossiella]MCK2240131.1 NlpC/P60 family protein [Crossiella sp. S99.2]MCK2253417.1 NlpC/P60 family protein [Crossiella sp. S99.1]